MANLMSVLRERVRGNKPSDTSLPFELQEVRSAVDRDKGIDANERGVAHDFLATNNLSELKSSAAGAALMYMLARFLKLKPATQVLLSVAGFGAGKLIYDYSRNSERFSTYNTKSKVYEIE